MKVLAFHPGNHDASACLFDDYRLVAAVSLERLTRIKGDGGAKVPEAAIDEVLAIAGVTRRDIDAVVSTRGPLPFRHYRHFTGGRWIEGRVRQALGKDKPKDMALELRAAGRTDALGIFDAAGFLADHGFRPDAALHFTDHHRAHALPTLFFTDWDEALLYTADGGGDNIQYSHRLFRQGRLETLWGGDEALLAPTRFDSLGLAYGYCTQALGFRINRHEGKLTGLAGFGQPTLYDEMARHFSVDEQGRIDSDFPGWGAMRDFFHGLAEGREPADVAASVQKLLEVFVLGSVERLLARHPVRRLGLSGGVFANVRLNRLLAESLPVDEVFVFPAMGDEGLPVGGALDWLLRQDGLEHWLGRRYRLDDVYLGRDFGAQADALLGGHPGVVRLDGDPVATAVELLAAGQAGAIYTGRMEFGPRALGARTILASPAVREINDSLNKRLTRTEFMPFAPVVRAEDADAVFDLPPASRYAARFMTVTCGVKEEWRARIPAVVHVDGTARPQLVRRADNPLYHDILTGFGAATGLPVLVNTSFNVHEEPIVNSPAECLRALVEDRVDFVVTPAGVYRRA